MGGRPSALQGGPRRIRQCLSPECPDYSPVSWGQPPPPPHSLIRLHGTTQQLNVEGWGASTILVPQNGPRVAFLTPFLDFLFQSVSE